MTILIALGSNRRHGRHGDPSRVVAAALRVMAERGIVSVVRSRTYITRPIGPSYRRYANAADRVETDLSPADLRAELHRIEAALGRRRQRRWGARVLDLDLLAYNDLVIRSKELILPHPRLHLRRFVLAPLSEIAPGWRHPVLGLTVRQMHARLNRRR